MIFRNNNPKNILIIINNTFYSFPTFGSLSFAPLATRPFSASLASVYQTPAIGKHPAAATGITGNWGYFPGIFYGCTIWQGPYRPRFFLGPNCNFAGLNCKKQRAKRDLVLQRGWPDHYHVCHWNRLCHGLSGWINRPPSQESSQYSVARTWQTLCHCHAWYRFF